MSDEAARAEKVERLREVLAAHLGPEESGLTVHAVVNADGTITTVDVDESGVHTIRAPWMPPVTDDEMDDETKEQ